MPLSGQDECQFKKLYCNTCVSVTVGGTCICNGGSSGSSPCAYSPSDVEDVAEYNFNPQLYPNPTTGECTVIYQVTDPSFVQITIFDMLGNQVRLVSSNYEGQEEHTLQLGTESLPSGNYACRIGDRAAYINLVIKK